MGMVGERMGLVMGKLACRLVCKLACKLGLVCRQMVTSRLVHIRP